MDLQAEKIELVRLLLDVEDERTLNEVKAVLKDDYDFYNDLPGHVKTGIERGIDDMNNGRVRDHESVMRDMRNKYGLKG
ncbi:hypothetical protein LJ707_06885 [Mucilaginibacter sp. UR6-1]|uniref:hypothetical protein n=1 Tax=Mucilaginibacter sp. UR6-1 TaxID=1435643 RepID=UPI001E4CD1F1|nr:hypothetical protein [Mucilaginibacter sp. UR6-1]MCC8408647.1 hypothetical protein [Mucilaginibacter sp. UR6-1]